MNNLSHRINDALIAQACALTGTSSLAELGAWVESTWQAHRAATQAMTHFPAGNVTIAAVDLRTTIEALLAWDETAGNDWCLVDAANGIAREIARRAGAVTS